MDYKVLLEKLGFVENIDFKIVTEGYEPLAKTRMVSKIVHIDEVPMVLNDQGGVITQYVPAHDEAIQIEEAFYPVLPTKTVLRQKHGADIRKKCALAIDIAMSFNSVLTAEQVDSITLEFAPIYADLKNNRPGTALSLIQAVVPDGILVKQEMKDMLIEILS